VLACGRGKVGPRFCGCGEFLCLPINRGTPLVHLLPFAIAGTTISLPRAASSLVGYTTSRAEPASTTTTATGLRLPALLATAAAAAATHAHLIRAYRTLAGGKPSATAAAAATLRPGRLSAEAANRLYGTLSHRITCRLLGLPYSMKALQLSMLRQLHQCLVGCCYAPSLCLCI
jgi:hypothetical protein